MEDAGSRIRAARRAKGMSLRALAEKVGVSASMLSLLENGRSRSSVRTLYAVVEALDMTMDDLFSSEDSPPPPPVVRPAQIPPLEITVVRADSRRRIEMETGVIWEQLGRIPEAGMEYMLVIYPPGAKSSDAGRYQRHHGVESAHVIQGRLTCRVGFDEISLDAGDSITFDSSRPHLLENRGGEEMRAVWVVLHQPAGTLESTAGGSAAPHPSNQAGDEVGYRPDAVP